MLHTQGKSNLTIWRINT